MSRSLGEFIARRVIIPHCWFLTHSMKTGEHIGTDRYLCYKLGILGGTYGGAFLGWRLYDESHNYGRTLLGHLGWTCEGMALGGFLAAVPAIPVGMGIFASGYWCGSHEKKLEEIFSTK